MSHESLGTCDQCHFGQFDDHPISGFCAKYSKPRVADQTCEKFATPQQAVVRPFVKKTSVSRKRVSKMNPRGRK